MPYTKAISLLLIAISGLIVIWALMRLHRLTVKVRAETYQLMRDERSYFVSIRWMMYVLVTAYAVAWTHVLLVGTNAVYLYLNFAFLLDALLTDLMIRMLGIMEDEQQQRKYEIIRTFVNTIEMKDNYTRGHSLHVYGITKLFCRQLHKRRISLCDPKLLDAALLHDIGKISVDDQVLNKSGELTPEEWEQMRNHPAVGKKLLDDTCFSVLGEWVLYHHERMDGGGYFGLSGDKIPLESRIIAVADTYSALTTNRAYRKAMDHECAAACMRQVAGTQLDAMLVDCFFTIPKDELLRCRPHQP